MRNKYDTDAIVNGLKKTFLYCDYVKYYKDWKQFKAYIFGSEGGEFGEEQVLLINKNKYRIATEKERLEILDLF